MTVFGDKVCKEAVRVKWEGLTHYDWWSCRDQDTDTTEEKPCEDAGRGQPSEAKMRPRENTNPADRTPASQTSVLQNGGKGSVCCFSQRVVLLWRPQQTNT